jgi:plasmid replication initiation protein
MDDPQPLKRQLQKKHKLSGYDTPNRPDGERWVTMSNALIRAGHGLSLAEKRIVCAAVAKLYSEQVPRPGTLMTTQVTAAEYAAIADCDMPTAYQALQTAAKNLFERRLTFFEPAYKRNGQPLKPVRVDMRWVGRCKYNEGAGMVELAWWPELLPSLMGLKKQFTSYQLKQAYALRSVYSWRLLELLTRFKSTGVAEYTIEDFATSMDATEKQKADFNNIRRRMIEPAVKELTEKDGWIIDWEPLKRGRKVAAVRFHFARSPQAALQFEPA